MIEYLTYSKESRFRVLKSSRQKLIRDLQDLMEMQHKKTTEDLEIFHNCQLFRCDSCDEYRKYACALIDDKLFEMEQRR